MPDNATCRGCGAHIVWIRTKAGRLNPCDPKELAVVTEAGEVVRGRVSHFATCPRAGEFRRRG